MNRTTCIHLLDLLLENLRALNGRACRWDAGHEHLDSVRVQDFLDSAPMCHLEWRNGRANGDGIKTKETMTEYDGILWG
jgi:hypothetical protein